MTSGKKDKIEFKVALAFDGINSKRCRTPKPIIDLLGTLNVITFKIKRNDLIAIVGVNKNK